MRSSHHLHGVLDMTPLIGFLGVALALASQGIPAAWAMAPKPCRSSICRAIVWICVSDVISLSLMFRQSEPQEPVPRSCCGFLETAEPEVSFHFLPCTI